MGASPESRVGFGMRLVASLIDLVFMIGGGVLIGAIFGGVLGSIFGSSFGPAAIEGSGQQITGAQAGGLLGLGVGILIGLPIFGTIYTLLEAFTGATAGKMILGMQIGDADGTKANLGQLFLRYAFKNIMFISSIIAGFIGIALIQNVGTILGVIWFIGCFLALTQSRQALHDKLLHTAVYPRKVLK